jgi:TPR repeat protein
MRRFGRVALALIALVLAAATSAQAEKRIALVIGNGAYAKVPRLPNPTKDSAAMAALLRKVGFDVVEKADLSADAMRHVLRDFSEHVHDADIAVVFYAGHGMEMNGANYLIPVDAVLARDVDVEDEAVSLERVIRTIEPARRLQLVILDSCRDNPFLRSMRRTVVSRSLRSGHADVDERALPPNMLIAYAQKAGATADDGSGSNSPYTTALLKYLPTPGLDVELALRRVRDEVLKTTSNRQEPFKYGSLGGAELPLVPAAASPQASSQTPAPSTPPKFSEAAESWDRTKDTTNIALLEAFIVRYKDSFFAQLARARIDELKKQEPPPVINIPEKVVIARPPLPTNAESLRLKLSADQGNSDAQATLGFFYLEGRGGLTRDDREAARLFKLSADQGNAAGQANLGVVYRDGRGLTKDDREAARLFKLSADQGNASGQTNLGFFYLEGRGGLTRDDREAARLFKLSADQGNADGQANLGFFYLEGRGGLTRDDREAGRLFKLSADQGNASGQANLGFFYLEGRGGLTRDDREAARLFKLSADQGNAMGQANLGVVYRDGRGLTKDDREAARLFKLSADQGNDTGRVNLGVFHRDGRGGLTKDDREAARLFKLSADQGNAAGQANLGYFYEFGLGGLMKDLYEAARLYKLSAGQGNADASIGLRRLQH